MGNTGTKESRGSAAQRKDSSVVEKPTTVQAYSYEEMKMIWQLKVEFVNGLFSKDEREKIPPIVCPEAAVALNRLKKYLEEEKQENTARRLIFIPLLLSDRWVSVMLYINASHTLASAAYVDSSADESEENKIQRTLIKTIIKQVYSDYSHDLYHFKCYSKKNVNKLESAVLALVNGEELLCRAILGSIWPTPMRICDTKRILEFQQQQIQTIHQEVNRQFSQIAALKLRPHAFLLFNLMLGHQGGLLSVNDMKSLMLVCRDAYRAVMQSDATTLLGITIEPKLHISGSSSYISFKGQLYACGSNQYGQLGLGKSVESVDQFTLVPLPNGVIVREVIVAGDFTFLVSTTGQLYACGLNGWYHFGLGQGEAVKYLRQFTLVPLSKNIVVREVITAKYLAFFVSTTGQLYACGNNEYGQLGLGQAVKLVDQFTLVSLPNGVVVREVIVAGNFTFFVSTTGQLYACGNNECGQLGLGQDVKLVDQFTLVPLPNGVAVREVIVAGDFTFFVSTVGQVYACGNNEYGQLGQDVKSVDQFTLVPLPNGVVVREVIVAEDSTFFVSIFFVSMTGQVYACGSNRYGQLGLGQAVKLVDQFTLVPLPNGVVVRKVIVAKDFTCLISTVGQVYVCGRNQYGQLGISKIINLVNQFIPMPLLNSVVVREVIAAGDFTCLISMTGELYACGSNQYGQLGLGNKSYIGEIKRVPLPKGVSLLPTSAIPYQNSDELPKDAWKGFMSLSNTELLLVLYKMRSQKADTLNRQAFAAIQAMKKGDVLSLPPSRYPNLFSSFDYYDPNQNYLLQCKTLLSTKDSVIEVDDSEEQKMVSTVRR